MSTTRKTGLYYLRSRYYKPERGRFVNADEILGLTGEALSHNTFTYCRNNQISLDDSTGNWPEWIGDFVDSVKDAVDEVVRNFNMTLPFGFNFSITTGIWAFSGQIGLSLDTRGNIGIQGSFAGGVSTGSPSASVGVYTMVTNAPTIYDLEGAGYQIGRSVLLPSMVPVTVGAEMNIIPNSNGGHYYGGTVMAGLGTPIAPGGEVHVEWGGTTTFISTNYITDIEKLITKSHAATTVPNKLRFAYTCK